MVEQILLSMSGRGTCFRRYWHRPMRKTARTTARSRWPTPSSLHHLSHPRRSLIENSFLHPADVGLVDVRGLVELELGDTGPFPCVSVVNTSARMIVYHVVSERAWRYSNSQDKYDTPSYSC